MKNVLLARILGREKSLFLNDIQNNQTTLVSAIKNSRVLIIGAAGSIGSAFVKQLLNYSPQAVHLVDISENNLVEVVRDVRSSLLTVPEDFKTFAVDFGSLEFKRLILANDVYDYVVNFAAMKHVRSEKDPYTLMRMFNTNAYYVKQLLECLSQTSCKKAFSVSSDKATNPANIMGATKIFMERIHLAYAKKISFSSARFANVAFSDGSLLCGFLNRLAKKQPFSAPSDVRRYFISHEEAGQLCLLSCFLGENGDVFFPKLDEKTDLITFSDIAIEVLKAHGLTPDLCQSESEAKEKAAKLSENSTQWPCYFFESDTTGEKPFEEFCTPADNTDFDMYENVGVIHRDPVDDATSVNTALQLFEDIKQSAHWSKEDFIRCIRIVVPELNHEEKNKNLDQKM